MRLWRMVTQGGEDASLARITELGLTLTQLKALVALEQAEGGLAVGELAERLGLSLPATSRTVDGLLRRGWLERREDSQDRRMKRVTLTREGGDIARRVAEARTRNLKAFAASLEPEQRARLHDALEAL